MLMNRFLSTLVLLLMLLLTCTAPAADFAYSVDENGGAVITHYTGQDAKVVLPAEWNGHPVTGIGDELFAETAHPFSIVIPDTVSSIGALAFNNHPTLICIVGRGSYAEQYCLDHQLIYLYPDWLEAEAPSSLPSVSDSCLLYYNPNGGSKYHADPNCPSVSEKYRPLKGQFTYAQRNDPEFIVLSPCSVCTAPLRDN